MITFILGAVVAIATAVLGWLIGNVIWALRRVKSLENENQVQWREIEERYN